MALEINLVNAVILGIVAGFSNAVGTYIAVKHAIDYIEKFPSVKEKVREYFKNEEAKQHVNGSKASEHSLQEVAHANTTRTNNK